MANENVKHGDLIVELKPGYSVFKQVIPPQLGVGGAKDLKGANFSLGWSLLTEPFLMVADSHKHDFDQVIIFMGGDPRNAAEFDGEVEFGLREQINSINYPACIYIPKGTLHGPLNIKRVSKPMVFIDITISPGHSLRAIPKGSERK